MSCRVSVRRPLGTVPREEASPPLLPATAQKQFRIVAGLEAGSVVAEPQIAQLLSLSFDDRGWMWVLQYRQFSHPNGLKPVNVDKWLQTEYDRRILPPPSGTRAAAGF